MSNAVAGHGAVVAMEKDPSGAAGTFTDVAELNGDITFPELTVPMTNVTPHNKTIDYHIPGQKERGTMQFTVNYIYDDGTHDHATGLQDKLHDGTLTGFRFRGPNGSADTDEVILSGYVIAFSQVNSEDRRSHRVRDHSA